MGFVSHQLGRLNERKMPLRHRSVAVVLLLVLVLWVGLSGCSSDKSFNAVVLSNTRGTLVIQPDEATNERKSSDRITLNTEGVAVENEGGDGFPGTDIQEGARIKIYYDGAIQESYSAQLSGCSKIILLDAI